MKKATAHEFTALAATRRRGAAQGRIPENRRRHKRRDITGVSHFMMTRTDFSPKLSAFRSDMRPIPGNMVGVVGVAPGRVVRLGVVTACWEEIAKIENPD